MKSARAVALAWGSLLLVLAAGLAAWSGGTYALLLVAGGAPILGAGALQSMRPPHSESRLLAQVSLPVVVVALGITTAAVGLTVGLWLGLIGSELTLFGLFWLWREIQAERRARQ